MIDWGPRGKDGAFAMHVGANEGETAAYCIEVERFGDRCGRRESGRESVIDGRPRREGVEGKGRVEEVGVVRGEYGRRVGCRDERREVEPVRRVILVAYTGQASQRVRIGRPSRALTFD